MEKDTMNLKKEGPDYEALYQEAMQRLTSYQNYINNLEMTIRVLSNLLNK